MRSVFLADANCIEILEARIAPAAVFDSATSAHYTDVDGDLVKVVFSKPILTAANVGAMLATSASGFGDVLQTINLTALATPQDAKGTTITLTAKRGAMGGDGLANVGAIAAANIDLGAIVIPGDLGRITAGDGDGATAGVKSLSVQSLGVLFSGGMLNESDITGALGALKVTGDVQRSYLYVTGNIGSVKVGGSLRNALTFAQEGIIYCTGVMGPASIGRDIGGPVESNGALKGGLGIRSVTVGGSIYSGFILGVTGVGTVKIGGEIALGSRVESGGKLGTVAVGGSVFGSILSGGDAASIVIRGDVVGSGFSESGYIHSDGALKSVVVGGSLVGPTLDSSTNAIVHDSGEISATGALGTVQIGGDLVGGNNFTNGGSLTDSGVILAKRIASITVSGSIVAGSYTAASALTRSGAIVADDDIGTIAVKGSLLGNPSYILPRAPVLIIARGLADSGATPDMAIKSIRVSGDVVSTNILAGYTKAQIGLNADAQIGSIAVGGDWVGSYAIAGIDPANGRVGDGDEHKLVGDNGAGPVKDLADPISAIRSIAIGGFVLGDRGTNNVYGFGAEWIGSFKNGTTSFPLESGAHNDEFGGTPATGMALPIGPGLSNLVSDGFAMHVFEV